MSRLAERVAAVPFWWHSIDLGDGIVTPGEKSPEFLDYEWWSFRVPPLEGKTFLDIGAWDGYFSFRAEREGASRVVALDHYVWMLDLARQRAYYEASLERHDAREFSSVPGLWQPETLPGKAGFDLARRALGSQVEGRVADFMQMELDSLGKFDVALFAGILYHMREPLLALERLARVTQERAIIETQAVAIGGMDELEALQFVGGNRLRGDPTNWWVPTLSGLTSMCRSVGFSRLETSIGPPDDVQPGEVRNYVAVVTAFTDGRE